MILVDTNVIIDIWKMRDEAARKVFESEEICICGVVKSELLHGAYSDKNLSEISDKLKYLTEINIKTNQWSEFGEFLYKLRTNGVTLPYTDALIAFTAIKHDVSVMSKDKHFKLIQVVEPALRLFEYA